MGRKTQPVKNGEKGATKYIQTWNIQPHFKPRTKKINLKEKSDFEFLYPRKVTKNIQNIVLSAEWMK